MSQSSRETEPVIRVNWLRLFVATVGAYGAMAAVNAEFQEHVSRLLRYVVSLPYGCAFAVCLAEVQVQVRRLLALER